MVLKFIDLFAWIWGFHIAFSNLWCKCVFASEWDKYARETYETNFKKTDPELFESWNFAWDITKINPNTIPDFDILCAWFPCQPFSQAWYKKWFEDKTRWTLFFNILEILKSKQPKAFFLENVRHLLNHDWWKTFEVIKWTLEELWYSFYYKIIKASDFWLPQHRPRLYMVWFKDKTIDFKFPEPQNLRLTMSDIRWWKCDKDIWFTLRVWWRWSTINDRRNRDAYLVDWQVKQLWVKEAKKMQGFPEDFEFPVSNTQAMKQLWNSVAIPAIQAVWKEMIYSLNKK